MLTQKPLTIDQGWFALNQHLITKWCSMGGMFTLMHEISISVLKFINNIWATSRSKTKTHIHLTIYLRYLFVEKSNQMKVNLILISLRQNKKFHSKCNSNFSTQKKQDNEKQNNKIIKLKQFGEKLWLGC